MRKLAVVLVGTMLLTLGWDVPSSGAEVDSDASRTSVLNVYWHSKRRVEGGTLRSTWYVGIYRSGDSLWSDLYQSVYRCKRIDGRRRCERVLGRYGEITELGDGTFTMANDLSSSHLAATYRLRTWRGDDRLPGLTTWGVSTDFEGIGELSRFAYSDSYSSGCSTWRFRSRGMSREGEASGTLTLPDGQVRNLGETYSAYAASGRRFTFERTCDEGGDGEAIVA